MRATLYDYDWHACQSLRDLEEFVGEEFACAMDGVQSSVQACLELLGTRTAMIPVIMPVTAPPDTLSGVLRAGAHPLLLDINSSTLQMDPDQLEDVLISLEEEGNTPVVLLTQPLGGRVDPILLEQVQDLPTILDARLLPTSSLGEKDLPCVFNIFDLTPICGGGAIILHKFSEQVKQLKLVRSGAIGLDAALSEVQAELALEKLRDTSDRQANYDAAKDCMSAWLKNSGPNPTVLWMEVEDAHSLAFKLERYDIEAVLGVFPLFEMEEVKRRYAEEPEYPVATKLKNHYLCIPADEEVCKKVLALL